MLPDDDARFGAVELKPEKTTKKSVKLIKLTPIYEEDHPMRVVGVCCRLSQNKY